MKIREALFAAFLIVGLSACSTVPAGNVGIKVHLLGGEKGVDNEVLGVGYYWIGPYQQLYTFPTFQQNYTWTKSATEGKSEDESITFQTKEGLEVNADIGISYHLDPDKVSIIFQKYRKGITEITDIYLRNYVRDAINQEASKMSVEETYGEGKGRLLATAQKMVSDQVGPQGIIVDKVYLIGTFRLPANVLAALNSKIAATQKAQQAENEVLQAKAEAQKEVALAQGQAQANMIIQNSLTPKLVAIKAIEKWDGHYPKVVGAGFPLIKMDAKDSE